MQVSAHTCPWCSQTQDIGVGFIFSLLCSYSAGMIGLARRLGDGPPEAMPSHSSPPHPPPGVRKKSKLAQWLIYTEP